MMKHVVLFSVLLTVSAGALAQEETQPPLAPEIEVDYSRDTLLRLFADVPQREDAEGNVRFDGGAVHFRALGMRWAINFLPFFAPFPGSVVTTNRIWPDPFVLTGTPYASPPRTWRRSREMSAELKRIERRLKATAKVTVEKPEK